MADEFEDFLSKALAAPERQPDREFVQRVQVQVRLDEYLRAQRSLVWRGLGVQIIGIAALAIGALWILRSPAISAFAVESPAILLLALLGAFSLVILLFSSYEPGADLVKRTSSR